MCLIQEEEGRESDTAQQKDEEDKMPDYDEDTKTLIAGEFDLQGHSDL